MRKFNSKRKFGYGTIEASYSAFFWCAWGFHRDFRFVEMSFGIILYIIF